MDNLFEMVGALVIGAVLGIVIGRMFGGNKEVVVDESAPEWWELRKALTGTQLQILQFMEARRDLTITKLQEKFSFIPDRELYYRLEQIVLMGFMIRSRRGGDVVYTLNEKYSLTVEDDKTVMLPPSD